MSIRGWTKLSVAGAIILGLAVGLSWGPPRQASAADITVYKTASCGCCGKWAEHLRAHGFNVNTRDVHDLSEVKRAHGVKPEFASCHTAVVDGYVVEGHVPADVIERLLVERPPVVGVAVPGMPAGSPGMEVGHRQPYNVITFDKDGKTNVYSRR